MNRKEFFNKSVKGLVSLPFLGLLNTFDMSQASELPKQTEPDVVELYVNDTSGYVKRATYCLETRTITLFASEKAFGYYGLRSFVYNNRNSLTLNLTMETYTFNVEVFHPSFEYEFDKVLTINANYQTVMQG